MTHSGCRVRCAGGVAVRAALLVGLALGPSSGYGFTWPWAVSGPWPGTSRQAVRQLHHPLLEARAAALDPAPEAGFRFAAFGDQRALADGEWQGILAAIAAIATQDERLLFLLDTGDIVDDGRPTDQFAMLRHILSPVRQLPYLVSVGNHELHDNEIPAARANTGAFLAYLDPGFSARRMYYRKDVGDASFLFLDTNDFIYGEHGGGGRCPPDPGSRAAAQLAWLARELGVDPGNAPVPAARVKVVVMHHPLLQASKRHLGHARTLWNCREAGSALADLFADGGVDLVLAGHTHTYERIRLRRNDGREFALVNLSGRPRTSVLWFGARARRPEKIAGREREWLTAKGFTGLERWDIRQEERMDPEREADQFGIFTVEEGGGLLLETVFLDPAVPSGVRRNPVVRLR